MKIKQIVVFLVCGLIVLSVSPFVIAQETLEIAGNGSGSTSTESVAVTRSQTVVQSNTAQVTNIINAEVSTGNNQANDNTGDQVAVNTGSATANITVTNALNANVADIDCTGCVTDIGTTLAGNGSESANIATIDFLNSQTVFQTNLALIDNAVAANLQTGNNEASRNTGGEVAVVTGEALANVNITNEANANLAVIGGAGETGLVEAAVTENGSASTNIADLNLVHLVSLFQDNTAFVSNAVGLTPQTGNNQANDNTAGIVFVGTGAAQANTTITNKANFNYASAECCQIEEEDTLAGNGSGSTSVVYKSVIDSLLVFQNGGDNTENNEITDSLGGSLILLNQVYQHPATGNNTANGTTVENDPYVVTGPATVNTTVLNEGGLNAFSTSPNWIPPVDFSFNLGEILNLL